MRKRLLLLMAVLFIFNTALASAFNILNERAVEAHSMKENLDIRFELVAVNATEVTFNETENLQFPEIGRNNYLKNYKAHECLVSEKMVTKVSGSWCHLLVNDISFVRGEGSVVRGQVGLQKRDSEWGETTNVTLSIDLPPLPDSEAYPLLYQFDRPEDFIWRMERSGGMMYPCPEGDTRAGILKKLEELQRDDVSEELISRWVEDCDSNHGQIQYHIGPAPKTPEFQACWDHVFSLFSGYDFQVFSPHVHATQECLLREYFNERYNEDTIPGYDQSLIDHIFKERDEWVISDALYAEKQSRTVRDQSRADYPDFEPVSIGVEDYKKDPERYQEILDKLGVRLVIHDDDSAEPEPSKPGAPESPPGQTVAPPEEKPPTFPPGHAEEKPGEAPPGQDKKEDIGAGTGDAKERPSVGIDEPKPKEENGVKAAVKKIMSGLLNWLSRFG